MALKLLAALVTVGSLSLACGRGGAPSQSADSATGTAERAPETPENHRAAAQRLLKTLDMQEVMDVMIDSSLESQMRSMPELRDLESEMRAFLKKYMSWDSLQDDFTRLYTEAYSQRELEDLLAFYATPTGKKSIELMPELARKGAEIGQRRVQQHLPELQDMLRAKLQELQQSGGPSK
jgi:hypothetical protein